MQTGAGEKVRQAVAGEEGETSRNRSRKENKAVAGYEGDADRSLRER